MVRGRFQKQPSTFVVLGFLVLALVSSYNGVLEKMGRNSLVYVVVGVLLALYVGLAVVRPSRIMATPGTAMLWFTVFYFIGVCGIQIASSSYYYDIATSVRSTLLIIWPIVLFLSVRKAIPAYCSERLLLMLVSVAASVAFLGFVQRYVSINIFGLIPDFKWQEYYEKSGAEFRGVSVLGTPQVYGLYCALFSIVALGANLGKHNRARIVLGVFIFFAGLLSGNKLNMLMAFLFWGGTVMLQKRARGRAVLEVLVIGLGVFTAFLVMNLDISSMAARPLSWILDLGAVIDNETTVRGSRWFDIIHESGFFGAGLGATVAYEGHRGLIPESYWLMLYAEGGPLGMLLPIGAFLYGIWTCFRSRRYFEMLFLFEILLSGGIVHAMLHPSFCFVWGIVVHIVGGGSITGSTRGTQGRSEGLGPGPGPERLG